MLQCHGGKNETQFYVQCSGYGGKTEQEKHHLMEHGLTAPCHLGVSFMSMFAAH